MDLNKLLSLSLNDIKIGISTDYINIEVYNDLDVIQVTLGNPYDYLYENIKKIDISKKPKKVFIHSKYCYNISKKNIFYPIKEESIFLKNIKENDTGIIIHLSKYYTLTREEGLIDIANKINDLCLKLFQEEDNNISILIETSYNINHLGSSINDFYIIFKNLNDLAKKHIGFCIDTSHIYIAGKAIDDYKILIDYLSSFEEMIGLKYVKLIHFNDINTKHFDKHTSHLEITKGCIFKKSPLSIEFILVFALVYDIPIILERPAIDLTEINFLKHIKLNITPIYFYLTIKESVIISFIKMLINYNLTLNENNNDIIDSLNKLNKKIIKENIYCINIDKKRNKLNLSFDTNIIPSDKLLNEYSYDLFTNYLNDPTYKAIKELVNSKVVSIEKARKLVNEFSIMNMEELKNQTLKFKKKNLSPTEYKALINYKFLKNNIPLDIIKEIIKIIDPNRVFYNTPGELDYLSNSGFNHDLIKKKGSLLNDNIIVCNYKKKNKNYYFILNIYSYLPEEKFFMYVYLKKKNNFQDLVDIALSKNYILTKNSLINNKTKKKIILDSEEEFNNLLDIII